MNNAARIADTPTFLSRLTPEAIGTLRLIIKRSLFKDFSKAYLKTDQCDRECDKIIEILGPETVEHLMARGAGSGLIDKKVITHG